MRRKIVNHYHRFPASMGGFSPEQTRPIFQTGSLGIGVGDAGFSDNGTFSFSSA